MDFNLLSRISIVKGDITRICCDAIVNAANPTLSGGGGVDGAIHRVAGPRLHVKCCKIIEKIGRLNPGEAVITAAYEMKNVSFIIHTVGPVWSGGNNAERDQLISCYKNSLNIAAKKKLKDIAFPAISTGVYLYPYKEAFDAAFEAVCDFLEKNDFPQKVIFVFYENSAFEYAQKRAGL